MRLVVAIQARLRGLDLAIALERIANHIAFQHRIAGADDQPAGITAYDIAVFVALPWGQQRVVEILGLAPTCAVNFIALVKPGIENIARRTGDLVQTAVGRLEPALFDDSALHIQSAAGQVDLRTGLGDDFFAGEIHYTALGHPLANAVALSAEVTGHFKQPPGGVPAIRRVAVGAGRDEHQLTGIHPHIVAAERPAIAVDRRIPLLVALNIDLDVVGFHRHPHAKGA